MEDVLRFPVQHYSHQNQQWPSKKQGEIYIVTAQTGEITEDGFNRGIFCQCTQINRC